MDKTTMTEEIINLTGKTNEDRVSLCEFYLNKHRFENYSLKDNNIKECDYILRDESARKLCDICINSNRSTEDDIRFIIGKMSYDDLVYMGI